MKIHDSLHCDDAGKVLKFYPCDDELAWEYNCKHNSEVVKRLNWTEDSVEYKFNSHGFRCNEFNDNPAIMFLGCSLTFGIGMPKESCWTYLVSNMLGLEEFNLANGGAANDTCFRLANYWIDKLRPKIVFYMVTFDNRLEIFGNMADICFPSDLYDSKGEIRSEQGEQKFTYEKWVSNRWNGELNKQKNIMAVKHICEIYGVKFCSLDAEIIEQDKMARDSLHPGIRSNEYTTFAVLDHIDEQIEFS
jgi:hypothetical protein